MNGKLTGLVAGIVLAGSVNAQSKKDSLYLDADLKDLKNHAEFFENPSENFFYSDRLNKRANITLEKDSLGHVTYMHAKSRNPWFRTSQNIVYDSFGNVEHVIVKGKDDTRMSFAELNFGFDSEGIDMFKQLFKEKYGLDNQLDTSHVENLYVGNISKDGQNYESALMLKPGKNIQLLFRDSDEFYNKMLGQSTLPAPKMHKVWAEFIGSPALKKEGKYLAKVN